MGAGECRRPFGALVGRILSTLGRLILRAVRDLPPVPLETCFGNKILGISVGGWALKGFRRTDSQP